MSPVDQYFLTLNKILLKTTPPMILIKFDNTFQILSLGYSNQDALELFKGFKNPVTSSSLFPFH